MLSAVLSSDKRGGWLSFFTSRGYLRHFVESVAQADNELQEALQLSPEPLRAVYIYESTMVRFPSRLVAQDTDWKLQLSSMGIHRKMNLPLLCFVFVSIMIYVKQCIHGRRGRRGAEIGGGRRGGCKRAPL